MTPDRLLTLIDAYGADPLSWPEDERASAVALLDAEPERFAAALADARALDVSFAAAPPIDSPPGLASRIIASAPQPSELAQTSLLDRLKSWLLPDGQVWPAAVTAASMLIGVMIGYGAIGADTSAPTSEADQAFYAALDTDYTVNFEEIGQ